MKIYNKYSNKKSLKFSKKSKKEAESPSTEKVREKCQAITKKGTRCKKYAMIGSKYCNVHQNYESK